MSRAYGAVQRQILAQLEDAQDWVTVTELAGGKVNGSYIDLSRYESTRRAVAKLAEAEETRKWLRGHCSTVRPRLWTQASAFESVLVLEQSECDALGSLTQ